LPGSIIHHVLDRGAESDAALQELIEKGAEDSAFRIAEVYAERGEVEPAFDWLERAYAQRDGGLTEMMASPHLRSIHGDPRWGAFLKKMGLVDQTQL
jgi:hypothetical protein